jgi:outer membrane protein assembly factor BamE (lipoprotein component of BamABCDE complex)
MKQMKKNVFGVILIFLAGCSPFVNHRGAQTDQVTLDQIRIGIDSQNQVRKLLGSPTHVSVFEDEKTKTYHWYYIQTIFKQTAFWDPQAQEQVIIQINFDRSKIVKSVQKIDSKLAVSIKPDPNKTPTTGYETTLLRDVFGNFGKYSNTDHPSKK